MTKTDKVTLLDKIEDILKEGKFGFNVSYMRNWAILRTKETVSENSFRYVIYYFDRDSQVLIKKVNEKKKLGAIANWLRKEG